MQRLMGRKPVVHVVRRGRNLETPCGSTVNGRTKVLATVLGSRRRRHDFEHYCRKHGVAVWVVHDLTGTVVYECEGTPHALANAFAAADQSGSFLDYELPMNRSLPRQGVGACNAEAAASAKVKQRRNALPREFVAVRDNGERVVLGSGRMTHASQVPAKPDTGDEVATRLASLVAAFHAGEVDAATVVAAHRAAGIPIV